MMIKKSEVKAFAKEKGFRVSGEFLEALDEKVKEMILEAIEKAEKKKMKTLKARHLE